MMEGGENSNKGIKVKNIIIITFFINIIKYFPKIIFILLTKTDNIMYNYIAKYF